MWTLVLQNDMWIQAAHIAGKDNVIADSLSRGKAIPSSTEWSLCPKVVQHIFNILGRPLVDLFAHESNAKLPTFCVWRKDPPCRSAWRIDAMSFSWDSLWAYAYPPLALVPRVLSKAAKHRCNILLVAPRWERRPWFPTIINMLYDYPLQLPATDHLLKLPRTDRFHPDPGFLNLTVWPISGIESQCQEFQSLLRSSSWRPGDKVHRESMELNSAFSPAGALNGVLIPLLQPWSES